MALEHDDFFAGCRILSVCGRGASGVVYLAENAIGRIVALKVLNAQDAGEKELRGIRNYMRIRQNLASLVAVHHVGIEDGRSYYIMDAADNASSVPGEYVPDTLANRLKTTNRVPLNDVLGFCLALVDGLAVMHDSGILHRDIKPENILFIQGKPVLGDPGLVGDFSSTLSISGTLGYLPPEFFRGKVKPSPSTDIYALGKVLYCSVTGNSPGEFPTMPNDLSEDTLASICRLLARLCNAEPKRRCVDCAECRRLLVEAQKEHGLIWRIWWRFLTDVDWRRKAILKALCCAFIILLVACFACDLWHSHQMDIESKQVAQTAIMEQVNDFHSRQPELSMQFDAMGEQNPTDEWLRRIDADVAKEDWDAAARDLFNAQDELTSCALKHAIPEAIPEDASLDERIDANARRFSFLASPLCKNYLPSEQYTTIRESAVAEADRLAKEAGTTLCVNGRRFHHIRGISLDLMYVPPGRFRSLVTGHTEEIKRPFWIMESELTYRMFAHLAHSIDHRHILLEQPAAQLGWNDYLAFCKDLTEFIRMEIDLPKGYAFRPPTEAEWEFASIGGTAYQKPISEPNHKTAVSPELPAPQNALKIMNMDRNLAELVLPYPGHVREGGWTVARGASFKDDVTGVANRFEVRLDQQTFLHVGFRPVLGPVDDGFFDSVWHLPLHAQEADANDKFYVGIECCHAMTNWNAAESFARALGGRLPEPKTANELSAIYDALKADARFPAFLGIVWRDGKWRQLSDGTASPFADKASAPTADSERICLGSAPRVRFYPIAPSFALPAWIVEFESREAFLKRPKHPCTEVFEVDGRRFGLLKITAASSLHSAIVEFAGYRVPILSDKETLTKVLERLKSVTGSVSLSCHRVYSEWRWSDSSKLPCEPPQEWHGTHSSLATMGYCVIVAYGGNLRIAADSDYILVEF